MRRWIAEELIAQIEMDEMMLEDFVDAGEIFHPHTQGTMADICKNKTRLWSGSYYGRSLLRNHYKRKS